MTTKTKHPKPSRYSHAADLPAALEELEAAFKAAPEAWFPVAPDGVAPLSMHAVWTNADTIVAGWQRVGAAARRVQVAQMGARIARGWAGFVRTPRRAA
jgi:hypothetical protein